MSDPAATQPPLIVREPSLFGDAETLGYGVGSVHDEMVNGSGRLRAHWRPLIGNLAPLDPSTMSERMDEVRRLLRQHGVTYAVYGDPQGADRPWPLDIVPLILPAEEWQEIEAAVIQRAQLLNALMADLYGTGRLVEDGFLPPVLVHGNPGFLRNCHGIEPPGGIFLHLTAMDLVRAPDGRWWVLADRTQAPSGAGYALENRNILGRVLADCLADTHVRPLSPFFAAFRDTLHQLVPEAARQGGKAPRIVLLTPGPYNETYFEHVYLARQLGITLVEGGDLTVRDRRVFLKTLNALEPVGVILRRLDDDFCDPLELRADSTLGIAGLAEAARAGTVAVANALGTGALEALALKPFLPGLARHLLGEELKMPDVPSWWCGGPAELRYVLDHLDHLVIKPALPGSPDAPVYGGDLSAQDRDALAARIRAQPNWFIAQEHLPLSMVPVWDGTRLQPQPLVLRVYVAATSTGFQVLPGGLTRTAPAQSTAIVSMQYGAGSKDTWVIDPRTAGPARDSVVSMIGVDTLARSEAPGPRAAAGELPSRAADGLYWVGRYAERVDGQVRLLRTLLSCLTDAAQPWTLRDVEPLLYLATWLELLPPLDLAGGRTVATQLMPMLQAALVDPTHPSGIGQAVQRLLRASNGVRDRLPGDCARVLGMFNRHIPAVNGRIAPARLLLRLDELVMLGNGLIGAVEDSMPRDAGWRFFTIGRRLERSIALVATARGMVMPPPVEGGRLRRSDDRRLLTALLTLTGARPPASYASDAALTGRAVLDAVFGAVDDPRALGFQLASLEEHLTHLPQPDGAPQRQAIRNAVDRARETRIELMRDLAAAGSPERNIGDNWRMAFQPLDAMLPVISVLLSDAYFAHAPV